MDNWMPPKLKAILTYGNEATTVDITEDITNWNELQTSMQRDGVSGVFMSVDMPIKVAFTAKTILHDLFFESFLSASASIQILQRDPFDLDTYTQIHNAKLNFSTFREDAHTVEIDSEARDFNNLVKSVGKTKYDLKVSLYDPANPNKVSDIDSVNAWIYKHNEVLAGASYSLPEAALEPYIYDPESWGYNASVNVLFMTNVSLNSAEIPLNGIANDFRMQEFQSDSLRVFVPQPQDKYFFQASSLREDNAVKEQTIALSFDFTCRRGSATANGMNATYVFYVDQYNENGVVQTWDYNIQPGTDDPQDFDIKDTLYINVSPDDKLRCYVRCASATNTYHKIEFSIVKCRAFKISYPDKSKSTETIAAVIPWHFANALLKKMGDGDPSKTYTVSIPDETDNPWPFNHFLVASESIRGFEDAQFHASFNDFLEYMQFLGYEWDVDESARVVLFKKRDVFFDPTITALELTEDEIAGVEISADDEYAYSTVRVGYEKPDIENTNGRFAVCGAFDYATDYMNTGDVRDSTLEIMCPYKADPVEIETLSWTRGEKTKDQKADNDIFMMAGYRGLDTDGLLIESRQTEYFIEDTDTNQIISWFNVPYIPYFITQRNVKKIGIGAKSLKFTGTDAYRSAGLVGVLSQNIYSDIELPRGLFNPVTYDFEAGTHQSLPMMTQRFGLVSFPWKGTQYRGFISKLVKSHNNDDPTNWTLLGYSHENTRYPIVFYGNITENKDSPQAIVFTGTITETV